MMPPPGGGGAALPAIGGVWLDQTAKLIGDLGAITGVAYDPASGRIILVGDKNTQLPAMKPEYLAAALKSVYSNSPEQPGMTIDPNPQNPMADTMIVRFFGKTENTKLGWVMFEADRLMKGYSIGNDNISKQPVQSNIPGYQSLTAMQLADRQADPKLWSRFWLMPETVTAKLSDDGHTIAFDPIHIRVQTETMRWVNGKLVSAGGIKDTHAETFAAHFTTHYEDYAKEQGIYAELKQVTQAVALAKWMKSQNIPLDWNLVRSLAGDTFPTPQTTPAASAEMQKTTATGRGTATLTVYSFGGVDMHPQLAAQAAPEAQALAVNLSQAWKTAQAEGKDHFTVDIAGQPHPAVALPTPMQKDLGSYHTATADLPGLSRAYDSFHNEPTEFGHGWSLLLPRLEFENLAEAGQTRFIAIDGKPDSRVALQRFTLTNAFGLGSARFDGHFIDQANQRIGFKPTSGNEYRGIYPEGEQGYRLLFTNGDQAVFDTDGNPRAYFTQGGQTFYNFDPAGRLAAIRHAPEKAKEQTIRVEYDGNNHISAMFQGDDRARYEYGDAGNLVRVIHGEQTTVYHYDHQRLLTEVAVNGQTVVRNTYDDHGRLLAQQDGNGNTLQQSVASSKDGGRTITTKIGGQTFTQGYDVQLRPTTVEGNNGDAIRYTYPEGGSTVADFTSPVFGHARIEQNANGRTTATEDPRGIHTEFRYDGKQRLAETLIDRQPVAAYAYDDQDRLAETRYADGAKEQLAYTPTGQLATYQRTAANGQDDASNRVNLSYDATGNPDGMESKASGTLRWIQQDHQTTISQGDARLSYRYDDQNRLTDILGPNQLQARYQYQADGSWQAVEMTQGQSNAKLEREGKDTLSFKDFDGGLTRYQFAEDGSLKTLQHPDGSKTELRFDAASKRQTVELPHDQCLEWVHDEQGRVKETTAKKGCGVIDYATMET